MLSISMRKYKFSFNLFTDAERSHLSPQCEAERGNWKCSEAITLKAQPRNQLPQQGYTALMSSVDQVFNKKDMRNILMQTNTDL